MSNSSPPTPHPLRVEFVSACVVFTTIATPIATAFFYHAFTGHKSGWGMPLLATVIAAILVGFWAAKARPRKWLLFTMVVVWPLAISIVLCGIQAIRLWNRISAD
ncbi:MAG: hypothetical protein KA020_12240 [Planctomycetes bacterium]|jgi:hypothetical protein|nr:hypothetical protein [Planctomycetota bacterium]